MVTILLEAGIRWNDSANVEETLAALRATYEPLLDGLASALLLPLPAWVARQEVADHWRRGHRGLIASRLIEELSRGGKSNAAPDVTGGRMAQGLRSRLRRGDRATDRGAAEP
jgi:hypothetical protein